MALVVLAGRVPRGQIPPARELEVSVARRQLVGYIETFKSRDKVWKSLEGRSAVRVALDRELALKLLGRARLKSVAKWTRDATNKGTWQTHNKEYIVSVIWPDRARIVHS